MSFIKEHASFLLMLTTASFSVYKMLLPSTPIGPTGSFLDDILGNSSRPLQASLFVASFLLAIYFAFTSALKKLTDHEKEERAKKAKSESLAGKR